MRGLLYWLTGFLPARYIYHEGSPYLERYYLMTIFKMRIYIHRFVDSDADGIHNHPFLHSFSFILAGWYWEDRWTMKNKSSYLDAITSDDIREISLPKKQRKIRLLNLIGPNDFHRVVLPDNGLDVWTMFTHTPRVRPWGILRPDDATNENSSLVFSLKSIPEDPSFSDWYKFAPNGKELRKTGFQIPLGKSHKGSGGKFQVISHYDENQKCNVK
jgi:hypothetical protein